MEGTTSDVKSVANARLLLDREGAAADLGTNELAAACAELKLLIDAREAEVAEQKRRFQDARKTLLERFDNEGTSQVRVETSDGNMLAFLFPVFAVDVPADRKDEVKAWLKQNASHLLEENFNANSFKAFVKRAKTEGEGEYPQELVDGGAIKVFETREVRFKAAS